MSVGGFDPVPISAEAAANATRIMAKHPGDGRLGGCGKCPGGGGQCGEWVWSLTTLVAAGVPWVPAPRKPVGA